MLIVVKLFGNVIASNKLQLSNTDEPIDVTVFGIVIETRPLQLWKALFAIDITW